MSRNNYNIMIQYILSANLQIVNLKYDNYSLYNINRKKMMEIS